MHRIVAVLGVAALAAAGCAGGEGSDGEGSVIRIAGLMPLTGPTADTYGASMVASIEAAFDDVNAEGGVEVAGERHPIEFRVFDDQCKPEASQSAAQSALDEDYEIFIGPICSGAASAVQPTMARSEAFWAISVAVDGPTQLPNVFRTMPRIGAYTDATVGWLAEHPEFQRIAIITDQNHTGLVAATDGLVEGIEGLGREIVANQQYQSGDTDFRAPVTEVIAADADLYLQRAYPAEAALLLQQTRELGGRMPVMWNAGLTNDNVESLVPDLSLMDGVYQAAPLFSLDTFLADGDPLAEEVAESVGDRAGTYTAQGHDLATIVLAALSRSEDTTPEAVQAAMTDLQASELEGRTLNDYRPFDDGRLFREREVGLQAAVASWEQGTGWVAVPAGPSS
ncbi:ABC transporter substrate-binding protein [Pseudonocardia nematodicida]|uniref:ABC transporter substrate-binding protein n=1 Tax=Pseudonocardia nematodicida TaxID=1206997 RepID=A0ABV1KH46_9PSEU